VRRISPIDSVVVALFSVSLIVWEQFTQNRKPVRVVPEGREVAQKGEDDDSFRAATVALPGWDATPVCQSAGDAVECEGRHGVLLDAGADTW
jgi:hypothetical protein